MLGAISQVAASCKVILMWHVLFEDFLPNSNSPRKNLEKSGFAFHDHSNVFPAFSHLLLCHFGPFLHFRTPKSTQFNTKQCGLGEESSNQLPWGLITIPIICVSKYVTHPNKQMTGRLESCCICWGSKQPPLATCDPQHHNTTWGKGTRPHFLPIQDLTGYQNPKSAMLQLPNKTLHTQNHLYSIIVCF